MPERASDQWPARSAPDIEPATLDETVPPDLTLFDLAVYRPAMWNKGSAMSWIWKLGAFAMLGAMVIGVRDCSI